MAYEQLSSTYVQPVGNPSKQPHGLLSKTVTIKEPGYVYIYVSNEGTVQQEIYFDDLTLTHTKGAIVQMDDYDPFGLTYSSHRRENSVSNDWKFQGQEHVDELNLGWDSFKWRNHMPEIGRFFNMDPLSEKYYYNSVYAFSENKVVAHVELEGLEAVTSAHSTGESPSGDGQRKKEDEQQGKKAEENIIYQKIKEFGAWLGSIVESMDTDFIDFSTEESTKKTETTLRNAKQVAKVAKVGKNLTEGDVQPYVTISVGKQSSEGGSKFSPGYGEVTLTPSGLEGGTGYDYSVSEEPISVSVSFGVVLGNSNVPADGNVAATVGINHLGLEAGTTTNFQSQNVGIVLSTEHVWGSVSAGGTVPLLKTK